MIVVGDCVEVMRTMEAGSFTACVCDPPYNLAFMGKEWDTHESSTAFQDWCQVWATEVLRLLKPGGLLLAFGGTRTHHRLMCGIEDAGFEIRDCLSYMYGSGFPKSLDISKAIDKAAGVSGSFGEFKSPEHAAFKAGKGAMKGAISKMDRPWMQDPDAVDRTARVYIPGSDESRLWQGYGTALKPAWEPVVVAMKPLDGTFAQNALKHGVAGVNVDGARIGPDPGYSYPKGPGGCKGGEFHYQGRAETPAESSPLGRWPANVLLDEDAAALLDAQTGESVAGKPRAEVGTGGIWSNGNGVPCGPQYGDSGGASRFFYTSKVSPEERGSCTHPTMKPLDLMRWLLTLVTMPEGTRVLDPFAGSGSTIVAAKQLGIDAVGIEMSEEYAAMAERRIANVTASLFSEAGQ